MILVSPLFCTTPLFLLLFHLPPVFASFYLHILPTFKEHKKMTKKKRKNRRVQKKRQRKKRQEKRRERREKGEMAEWSKAADC